MLLFIHVAGCLSPPAVDYICVECVKDIVKRLFNGQDPVGKVSRNRLSQDQCRHAIMQSHTTCQPTGRRGSCAARCVTSLVLGTVLISLCHPACSAHPQVPNSGPAPALLRFTELEVVTPDWERLTAAIEADKEAVKALGQWAGLCGMSWALVLSSQLTLVSTSTNLSPYI
jgi:hypothetical protein